MTISRWLLTPLLAAALSLPAFAKSTETPKADPAISAEDRLAFFIHAARGGDLAAVQRDFETGQIDINAFDRLSQNALIAALSHNQIPVVQYLIDHGASTRVSDPAGWTPLIHAVYAGADPSVLQSLLAAGADVNARNQRGVTALYLASAAGRESQVKFLLAHGAQPDLATDSGYTPARIARLKGLDRIAALLEAPAAPKARP